MLVYSTVGSRQEAEALAHTLVQEQLAACVQVLPGARSFYRWEGALEQAEEVVLLAKTTKGRVPDVMARLTGLHAYDVPCVLAVPVEQAAEDFARWVNEQVGG